MACRICGRRGELGHPLAAELVDDLVNAAVVQRSIGQGGKSLVQFVDAVVGDVAYGMPDVASLAVPANAAEVVMRVADVPRLLATAPVACGRIDLRGAQAVELRRNVGDVVGLLSRHRSLLVSGGLCVALDSCIVPTQDSVEGQRPCGTKSQKLSL